MPCQMSCGSTPRSNQTAHSRGRIGKIRNRWMTGIRSLQRTNSVRAAPSPRRASIVARPTADGGRRGRPPPDPCRSAAASAVLSGIRTTR